MDTIGFQKMIYQEAILEATDNKPCFDATYAESAAWRTPSLTAGLW
jgi:hypothetical protein